MTFFVSYITAQYDQGSLKEFETEQQVTEFLNSNASNPDFKFDVLQGVKVTFEPVAVATQYRKK